MEDRQTTYISSSDGDEAFAITSIGVRGHLDIKKYGTQASNTNWFANGTVRTLMIDILSASRWSTCQEIEQRTIFVSWNVVRSSDDCFRYAPRFLLRFTSELRACSSLITFPLAACRYMALEGTWILIKTISHVVKLSRIKTGNRVKIVLHWHFVLATIEHSTCSSY